MNTGQVILLVVVLFFGAVLLVNTYLNWDSRRIERKKLADTEELVAIGVENKALTGEAVRMLRVSVELAERATKKVDESEQHAQAIPAAVGAVVGAAVKEIKQTVLAPAPPPGGAS